MPMDTLNITSGPSQARIIQSFADAFKDAKTEVSFTVETKSGKNEVYIGYITKMEYDEHSGTCINFGGVFKRHGFIKGWYNAHKRTGFIYI